MGRFSRGGKARFSLSFEMTRGAQRAFPQGYQYIQHLEKHITTIRYDFD